MSLTAQQIQVLAEAATSLINLVIELRSGAVTSAQAFTETATAFDTAVHIWEGLNNEATNQANAQRDTPVPAEQPGAPASTGAESTAPAEPVSQVVEPVAVNAVEPMVVVPAVAPTPESVPVHADPLPVESTAPSAPEVAHAPAPFPRVDVVGTAKTSVAPAKVDAGMAGH